MVTNQKTVVLIELTVPYEERVDEAHERKRLKYQELVELCQDKEWKTWCFPVEVGCRGFPAQSVWQGCTFSSNFSRADATGSKK